VKDDNDIPSEVKDDIEAIVSAVAAHSNIPIDTAAWRKTVFCQSVLPKRNNDSKLLLDMDITYPLHHS
jgi:MoxR-like ATPase